MAVLLKLIGLSAISLLINSVTAANMAVGGANGGWDLSTDLQSWASSQTFAPGDTLTFSFGSFHSVVEVPKADYEACTINTPIKAYTSGSAVVKLSSPGKRYFVCGTPGHCGQGMKMEIDIASASEVINAPAASPVIPTPALSSPPPVDGLTMAPQSIPAPAPLKPPAALSPIIQTSGPPLIQSPEAAGPSLQVAQGENSGGRQVEAGIVLVVGLLMALAQ
ncbi:Blue copper protein [Dendrobium catenatum]|uniref:Blue copper protein n=2 Tax=Dendrobium catenatum TaxID=906689 RepID=A0A2I0W7A6_9ASPA|nr:Blue copper protein [Dendrobium catenatum]